MLALPLVRLVAPEAVPRSRAVTTVVVTGEIDLASAERLALPLRPGPHLAPVVHLDLRGITFMDVSGLRILLLASRRAAVANGHLGLSRMSPQVRRLLQLTHVQTVREPDCGCLRLVDPA